MTEHRRSTDQPGSQKSRRTVVIVSLLAAAAVAAAFAAAGTALWLNAGRTDQVAQFAQQIQDERARNVRRACKETNDRHDKTIRKLHALVNAIPDPERRKRAEQGIKGSVAIIEAIVPHADCEKRVRQQVDTK